MFLKGKPIEEYEGFSRRLVDVAQKAGLDDTRKLAEEMYDNEDCRKAIIIRKTKEKSYGDQINNIMKNIQNH